MRPINSRFVLLAYVAIATFLLPVSAVAVPLDAGLTINGSIVLDADDPDLAVDNSYTANVYSTVGGVTSAAVTNVDLTDTGDGYGHTASLSGTNTSVTTLGADYTMTATNGTVDTYCLTFGITFSHDADADSDGNETGDEDARARTRLEVENALTLEEYLYSRLTSESGDDYAATHPTWVDQIDDEIGSTTLGTNGAPVSFGETRYFTIELLAGESRDLTAEFTLDGRIFDPLGSYEMNSSMFVFLDSFENKTIPEPSSLALLGLAGLATLRRRH